MFGWFKKAEVAVQKKITASVLRHALTTVGGALVMLGYLKSEDVDWLVDALVTVIGGVSVAVGAGAAIYRHFKAE